MDRARQGLGEVSAGGTTAGRRCPRPFMPCSSNASMDDALLKLAGLRFAQVGMAAEVYADTPDQLEHVLQFVPSIAHLPFVHLNRAVNVLHGRGRNVVGEFADCFAGRVAVWSSMTNVK